MSPNQQARTCKLIITPNSGHGLKRHIMSDVSRTKGDGGNILYDNKESDKRALRIQFSEVGEYVSLLTFSSALIIL